MRRAQRDLRVEAAQGGRLEAGGALQGVGEEGRLHLGHVVQRGQRRTAQHEGALAVSLHLPHGQHWRASRARRRQRRRDRGPQAERGVRRVEPSPASSRLPGRLSPGAV